MSGVVDKMFYLWTQLRRAMAIYASAVRYEAVSKSDTTALEFRAIYVGTGGDLHVRNAAGNTVVFKNVSDGTVVAVNEKLVDAPELINEDPYGEGWMFRLQIDDSSQLDSLLDASAYEVVESED